MLPHQHESRLNELAPCVCVCVKLVLVDYVHTLSHHNHHFTSTSFITHTILWCCLLLPVSCTLFHACCCCRSFLFALAFPSEHCTKSQKCCCCLARVACSISLSLTIAPSHLVGKTPLLSRRRLASAAAAMVVEVTITQRNIQFLQWQVITLLG